MKGIKNGGRLTDRQVGFLLVVPGLAVFAAIILYPFVDAVAHVLHRPVAALPGLRLGLAGELRQGVQGPLLPAHPRHHRPLRGAGHPHPLRAGLHLGHPAQPGLQGQRAAAGPDAGELDHPRHRHRLFVELDLQRPVRRAQRPAHEPGHPGQGRFLDGPDPDGAAVRGHRPLLADAALVHGLSAGRAAGRSPRTRSRPPASTARATGRPSCTWCCRRCAPS